MVFSLNSIILYTYAPSIDAHFELDSYVYDYWGRYFLEHGSFFDPSLARIPMQPVGYHFFVTTLYALGGSDYRWIIFVQFLMTIGCLLFIYSLAKRISNETIARISMAAGAFHIGFLVYSQLILAEILTTFLWLLFFDRVLRWLNSQSAFCLAQAFIVLALSTLVKPLGLVYIYPFLVFIAFYAQGTIKRKFLLLLMGSTLFFTPILLYMYSNYILYGAFIFAPMMAVNMCQFMCKLISSITQQPYDELLVHYMPTQAHYFDKAAWYPVYDTLTEYISLFPLKTIIIWLINVIKTALGLFGTQLKVFLNPALKGGACSYFNQSSWNLWQYITYGSLSPIVSMLCLLEAIANLVRLVCIPLGLYALRQNRSIFVFILTGIVTTIVITGTDGCARYRMPMEGFYIILTVIGLVELKALLKIIFNNLQTKLYTHLRSSFK
jgi:4-amino-4-deoxy-L-arabinose transferase-like glycosyltransferase